MKDFLFGLAGLVIVPIAILILVIYGILYVMQLLFRAIIIGLEKFMTWVDKILHKIYN
jgi:hypothetical protein